MYPPFGWCYLWTAHKSYMYTLSLNICWPPDKTLTDLSRRQGVPKQTPRQISGWALAIVIWKEQGTKKMVQAPGCLFCVTQKCWLILIRCGISQQFCVSQNWPRLIRRRPPGEKKLVVSLDALSLLSAFDDNKRNIVVHYGFSTGHPSLCTD